MKSNETCFFSQLRRNPIHLLVEETHSWKIQKNAKTKKTLRFRLHYADT